MSKGKYAGREHNRAFYAIGAEHAKRFVNFALSDKTAQEHFREGYLKTVKSLYGATGSDSPRRIFYSLKLAEHAVIREGEESLHTIASYLVKLQEGKDPEKLYQEVSRGNSSRKKSKRVLATDLILKGSLEERLRAAHGFTPDADERRLVLGYHEEGGRRDQNSPEMARDMSEDSIEAGQRKFCPEYEGPERRRSNRRKDRVPVSQL